MTDNDFARATCRPIHITISLNQPIILHGSFTSTSRLVAMTMLTPQQRPTICRLCHELATYDRPEWRHWGRELPGARPGYGLRPGSNARWGYMGADGKRSFAKLSPIRILLSNPSWSCSGGPGVLFCCQWGLSRWLQAVRSQQGATDVTRTFSRFAGEGEVKKGRRSLHATRQCWLWGYCLHWRIQGGGGGGHLGPWPSPKS